MKPANFTMPFTRGDDVRIPFRYRTKVFNTLTQAWEPGDPIDITGWTAKCQFRPTYDSTTFIEATMVVDPDQTTKKGFFYLYLTSSQSVQIATDWVYDIELTPIGGPKETYISGKTKVKLDSTR